MQITQTSVAVGNATKPDPNIAVNREKLLNPLPNISVRGILVVVMVVAIYAWGVRGTKASLDELVKGIPNMVAFVVRLFPVQFDWTAVAKLPVEIPLPFTINADKVIDTLDGDAELEQVKQDLAESVPLDQLIESGQPMPDDSTSTNVIEESAAKPWFALEGSKLTRIWVPGILPAVIETLQMAIIGTTLSIFLSLPFALLAARNTSPHPLVYQATRLFMNSIRAIPELIIALIFVAAVGLGPFTGVLALGLAAVGSISRLYAEAIEQVDPQQVLAVRATGASQLNIFIYAVMPQVLPLIASYSLVYFEYNVRAATIVGIVGAGGVGLALQKYMGLFQFRELMGAIIVLVIAVTVIDRISARLRASLI